MDKLVGELLTLARLDAGMTGNLDEEVNLQEIVADVADDARFEADSKGCSLRIEMDDLAIVRGNHELLYRAIENVVRNAVRHSPQGQSIEISTHMVGESLRVVVADRGPGVSADDLAAIFEPFVRSGLARSSTGYGLGLAITRRVAEAHGGKVFAANRPEGGLFVTMELPFGSERLSAPSG
jgi:signal transduction histidine kinase